MITFAMLSRAAPPGPCPSAIGTIAATRMTVVITIGRSRLPFASMIASVPFLVLFVFSTEWLSTAALALGGLTLLFTNPVNVVIVQELAPTQAGSVSAMMMGFA